MKKTLLVLFITLLATVVFAFPAGTFNIGGQAGFNSYKADSDTKAANMVYLNPIVGYFFMDNLSADVLLLLTSTSQGRSSWSDFNFGLGARYFMDMGNHKLYAGLGATFASYSSKFGSFKSSDSGTYLNGKFGILMPITEDVFFDLGAKYEKGLGDFKDSSFGVNLGLQIFTPLF